MSKRKRAEKLIGKRIHPFSFTEFTSIVEAVVISETFMERGEHLCLKFKDASGEDYFSKVNSRVKYKFAE